MGIVLKLQSSDTHFITNSITYGPHQELFLNVKPGENPENC